MRVLLINPGNPKGIGPDQSGGDIRGAFIRFNLFRKSYFAIPLALPTLAAVTPERHSVKIIDEMVTPVDFDEPCDVVGSPP